MSTAPGLASRHVAYRALRDVHTSGGWSGPAVDAALQASDLDARDRAFAANLTYSTLRWEGTLDAALARVSSRPLADVEDALLDVLRMGAWQLMHGGVPDRAAVATSVDLAREVVGARATGFVNGVLRGLARSLAAARDEPATAPLADLPAAEVAERLGYPSWIVAAARAAFGIRAEAVLAAGNTPPGLTLRAAPRGEGAPRARLRAGAQALRAELVAAGVDARLGHADGAVRAAGADPARLAAVTEGRASVQDEASQLVVLALEAACGGVAGARIVDLCAAPGGKTAALAELGAHVVATDLRPARCASIAAAIDRLSLTDRVHVVAADGLAPPLRAGVADVVLVDAPCTGLGVVRRRPELRWRRTAGDPARLGALQQRLVVSGLGLLRPGGVLLYSVCTWTLAETSAVTAALGARAAVQYLDPASLLPGVGTVYGDGLRLDPDRDGTDGMYLAVLRATG